MIEVTQTSTADPLEFDVAVGEGSDGTQHHVTLAQRDYEKLTGGAHPPERCIEAAFRFLLDREPKEAIMTRFDVAVISRYFPEFEDKLPGYLAAGSGGGSSGMA